MQAAENILRIYEEYTKIILRVADTEASTLTDNLSHRQNKKMSAKMDVQRGH